MNADLERIRTALFFVPVGGHDERVRMAFAVKSELTDSGFELWDEWYQRRGDAYDANESKSVWKSAGANGKVTIGTLFHEAKAHGWRDDETYQMPTPEQVASRKFIEAERCELEQAEIAKERERAAKNAAQIWKSATVAKADHPYLVRKKVSPALTIREIDAQTVKGILGYAPKSDGVELVGRLLVIPVKQGDMLSTLELIDESGRKAALAGRGTKSGGYWATQPLAQGDGEGHTLLIGEGVATVCSPSSVCGHTGVAALSSGNLQAVAKHMRERLPKASLVLLADLVKATGKPDPHATEAARVVRGKVAIPGFGAVRAQDDKDFNDLHVRCGADAVRRCVEGANAPAGDSTEWPQPQPLVAKVAPEPYPIDALPTMIRIAVNEVAGFVKAPLPMVASSALAALSLAIQAYADAQRAEKLHGPVGLFLLTIADSGERKSTCDGFFTKAIRDFEEVQAEAAKPILKDYNAAIEAWDAKRSGVKEQIRQLAKGGKSTKDMESALRNLEDEKPEPPRTPRLLYADATPEALAYGLAKQWPSGGVVSAEAGIVFGSHGMGKESVMRNLGLLNQLWDGTSLTIDRRSTESFTVRGARLTVALQVQEPTLREFFTRSGALARGTGFLARFLVAWPESTQGSRPFTEAPANWPALAAFNKRVAAILAQPAPIDEDGALTLPMLSLTPEAKAAWVEYHDAIERELSSGGELYDVRDVASKSADNAARLAALFQVFEGEAGAIGAAAFEGASRITAWHLNEARRFFGELGLPAELADAARLDTWLIGHCKHGRPPFVGKNHVRQQGPIRDGARLDGAIRELADLDRVRLVREGKRLTIQVNPALVDDGGAS